MTSHRVPPRHPNMPPIPQDGDGPVFREPWEAQAFAMALALEQRGDRRRLMEQASRNAGEALDRRLAEARRARL